MFLKKNFFLFLISVVLFGLSSCKDDDPVIPPAEAPTYKMAFSSPMKVLSKTEQAQLVFIPEKLAL